MPSLAAHASTAPAVQALSEALCFGTGEAAVAVGSVAVGGAYRAGEDAGGFLSWFFCGGGLGEMFR